MQRLALLIIVAALVAMLSAFLMRRVAQKFEQRGGLHAMTTGGMMQKVAFFMLLCLIVYVSISGAT